MTDSMFDRISPHAFGTITHTVFVTVNGNEEYDSVQFTMTGHNVMALLVNIAHKTMNIVSEQLKNIDADDILIDIYHFDSDEDGQYSVLDQRTNLSEIHDFLLNLGARSLSAEIAYFSMDYYNEYPEPDFVGECNDASFDPDRSTIGR